MSVLEEKTQTVNSSTFPTRSPSPRTVLKVLNGNYQTPASNPPSKGVKDMNLSMRLLNASRASS